MNQFLNYTVAPLSKNEIENIVSNYLKLNCPRHLQQAGQLNVEFLIDVLLYKTNEFVKVISHDLAPGVEAVTHPLDKLIEISEKANNGIIDGDPHYRFTGCHEAFHVICHAPQVSAWSSVEFFQSISMAREMPPAYIKPEWQAEYAGGVFLMPKNTFVPFIGKLKNKRANRKDIIQEIMRVYNVSYKAAEIRLDKLSM